MNNLQDNDQNCNLLTLSDHDNDSERTFLALQKKAPAQRPAHKVLQEDVVLEGLLDIETVTTAFPVILGMERSVALNVDPVTSGRTRR